METATIDNKTLESLVFKSALLVVAIKMRVDFFELIRSTTLEEYNRENPLYPLKQHTYDVFKKSIKDILNESNNR